MLHLLKQFLIIFAIIAAVLAFTFEPAGAQSLGESMLPKGDSISVYIDAEDFEILKNADEGQIVKIKALENVTRFERKLINKNQPVFCTVLQRKGGGAYAGGGKLEMRIDSTHSTGRTMIPLRGSVLIKGKGGGGKKIISIVLFPIGWLIKGSDIEFPEGKNVYRPVVKDDTPLKYQK